MTVEFKFDSALDMCRATYGNEPVFSMMTPEEARMTVQNCQGIFKKDFEKNNPDLIAKVGNKIYEASILMGYTAKLIAGEDYEISKKDELSKYLQLIGYRMTKYSDSSVMYVSWNEISE